ncbi:sugar transporter [Nannochloropsis oceanica]
MTLASVSPRLWASAFTIGLSSLLFGYSLACLNTVITCPSKPCPKGSILTDLDLSLEEEQLATAMTILGAMIGGLFASYPNDHWGRRKSLLVNNVFFIVGGVLTAITSLDSILVGRFLLGLGTGVESMVAPVLLSEIASNQTRGAITSLHQLNITLGILISNLIGYGFVPNISGGWRYVQLFVVLPAGLQLILFWLVPESPRWLLRADRREEARDVLSHLRIRKTGDAAAQAAGAAAVEAELVALEKELGSTMKQPTAGWKETFSYGTAMRIGMLMMFFSAMTGINTVIFYSTTIFALAGVENAFLGTVLVGVLNVFITMVSGYLVDKAGRKVLLTGGTWIMLISLLLLGGILLAENVPALAISIVAVGSMLLYVFGFAIGIGAVQWVVVGEVVPTKIRSKAYSIFVTSNWTANLLISLVTLSLIDTLGEAVAPAGALKAKQQQMGVALLYFCFAGMCVLCLLFLYGMVPETKHEAKDGLEEHHHHACSEFAAGDADMMTEVVHCSEGHGLGDSQNTAGREEGGLGEGGKVAVTQPVSMV